MNEPKLKNDSKWELEIITSDSDLSIDLLIDFLIKAKNEGATYFEMSTSETDDRLSDSVLIVPFFKRMETQIEIDGRLHREKVFREWVEAGRP